MFTGIVPGPPSKPIASQSTKAAKSNVAPGRKITNSLPNGEPEKDKTLQKRKKGATTMDELDRMLDKDHIALLSMKKDIGEAQKQEITKSGRELLNLQKEYDALRIANGLKEKELAKITDDIVQLRGLESVACSTTTIVQDEVSGIKSELKRVNDDLDAEQRTLKMLTLISKRLTDEIAECRVQTTKVQFDLDIVKHEVVASESTLTLSRQELAVQEKQVDSLLKIVKARREERSAKLKQLKTIVADGEASVNFVRLQTSPESGFDVSKC